MRRYPWDLRRVEMTTEVVSAVMIRDGRVFLTQRREDQSYPMLLETPGGKVEPGEDPRMALKRELSEELAFPRALSLPYVGYEDFTFFEVAQDPIFVAEFGAGDIEGSSGPFRVSFYVVRLAEGAWPVGAEGQGSGWFDIPAMRSLKMLPGNEQARSIVEREIVRAGAGKS